MADWKQQHTNPYRADGVWVGVHRRSSNHTFDGRLATSNKTLCLPTRPTPELAAQDVDRVIYKARGADAPTNGTLTPESKAYLDGMTLEEVVAQIKATGGHAFSRGSSAYRGVNWRKAEQKWRTQFQPGGGRPRLQLSFDSELEAARQYDAWCRQYGRPLTEYNLPPAEGDDEDGAAPAAAAPAAAAPAAAAVAALLAVPSAVPPASAPPPAASGDATATAPPAAPAAAAAGPSAPAPAPAAPAQPATNMFSPYQEWLEGEDEGAWWTDSSDWEEEDQHQQAAEVAAAAAAAAPAGSTPAAGTSTPGAAADAAAAAQPAHPNPMLIAWRQLHGEAPVPSEVQALMRTSSGRSTAASAAAVHQQQQQQQQQQEAEDVPASAAACARMLAAFKQGTTMSSDALPAAAISAHQPNMEEVATGQAAAGTAAATSAAAAAAAAAAAGGGSSTGGAGVQAPVLDIECERLEQFRADRCLATAALARAAAAITQHPSCISAAETAVAAAGAEPPAAAVAELETALRTAASQAVPELQPGCTHYWRGSRAWKYSQQHPTASSTSSGTSTAAAAATTAFQAATPAAAISAALAAAEAEGRGCSAADLQAAWLMQRLSAGLLRVNVRPPAVDMAVLEQALADHGVDVIPGIDYEPVPGLQPELFYPYTAANNPSTDPIPPAAAATTAADAPSKADSTAGGPAGRDQAAAGCSKDAAVAMDIIPASDTAAAPDTTPPAAPAAAAGQPAAAGAPSQTIDWAALAEAAEAEAAASATYPYPVPGERRPFDDSCSEEEEPFEAEWLAALLQGKSMFGAAAAEAAGPTPPYGPSPAATAAAAEASAAAATAAALGGCGLGGSVDGGVGWGAAADRRRHKERMEFDRSHIPTIKIDWTGNEMKDTVNFLQAVVAEGEADHLPSHIKAYRIAELARQKDPNFPLEEVLAMGRPIEGEYCPVVLGVPPSHPDAPAVAAAAAAAAAEGVRRPAVKARIENAFDPVNRRPPQALVLPGCSYTGQKAAARRATAAARAALQPAEEPAAAVGLAAAAARAAAAAAEGSDGVSGSGSLPTLQDRAFAVQRITMVGGDKLVQQLRPVDPELARAPGAAVHTATAQQEQQQQDEVQAGSPSAAAAGSSGGVTAGQGSGGSTGSRRVVKAVRRSGAPEGSAAAAGLPADHMPAAQAAAAAGTSTAARASAGQSAVAAAAAAAAAKVRSLTSCNEVPLSATAAPAGGPAAAAAAATLTPRKPPSSSTNKTPAAPAAATAAAPTKGSSSASSSKGKGKNKPAPKAAAACKPAAAGSSSGSDRRKQDAAAVAAHLNKAPAGSKPRAQRVRSLQDLQRKARVALAAATSAPVVTAGIPGSATAEEDHHLSAIHPSLLAAAAEAATEAASAALQPQPMEVDWTHPEDVAGEMGMWRLAEQGATACFTAALQAAKDRAAALAAAGSGDGEEGGAAAEPQAAAAAAAAGPGGAGSSRAGGGGFAACSTSAERSAYLKEQIGVMMGFIKADSCPAISAAEEAALGMKMPRPLAIVHEYGPGAPAAAAATAAVAALVPGGGLTHSSAEEYPPAGTEGDVTRVSFGAAERGQRGLVAELEAKVQRLRRHQERKDAAEAAFQAGDPAAAFQIMYGPQAQADKGPDWVDPDVLRLGDGPAEVYAEAGGSGSWPQAGQLLRFCQDNPAIVAAVELGLELAKAVNAEAEREYDQRQQRERQQQQQGYDYGGSSSSGSSGGGGSSSGGGGAGAEQPERDLRALIDRTLPRNLPMRAKANALLAYRAASRHQAFLMGYDFPEDDLFDLYYEVKLPRDPDEFWDRVRAGEIGRSGLDGLPVLAQPPVRYYERIEWFNTLEWDEQQEVLDAELRWEEECRIVEEARWAYSKILTAPGSLLRDIVVGAHIDPTGMDDEVLGARARDLVRTSKVELVARYVQERIATGTTKHADFWQATAEFVKRREAGGG